MKPFLTKNKKAVSLTAISVFALLIPLMLGGNSYYLLICCCIELYIIAVSGLDILTGYSGQISLGHMAFFAIGAYGSGILNKFLNIPALVTMVIASCAAAAIGALLALPASRLKFSFLSLATIAFGEIVYELITHSPNGITGNFNGMFVNRIEIFGLSLKSNIRFYYFGLVCLAFFLAVKYMLSVSKVGRAMMAVRENTHAANGMGINVRKYKIIAFATSAFFTAYAGSMYAHLVGYIGPETFATTQSVIFLVMLLFGGMSSMVGPVIGVVCIQVLNEFINNLSEYKLLIYGAILLIVIMFFPGGVYKVAKNYISGLRRAIQLKKEGGKDAAN